MAAAFVSLFGEELASSTGLVKTSEALDGKVVGIYFSAHWCPPCRGFTPKLAEAYNDSLASKGFEVVFVSWDKTQEAFDEYYGTMPWKALPFAAKGLKDALGKKYKVNGIPTLVILDADGSIISTDGRSAVMSDPSGEDFPWRPKPVLDIIGTELLGPENKVLGREAIEGKVLGLYFSAHWCPPCRGFTPQLAEWYKNNKPNLPDFEIVFVSSDQSEEQFKEYFAEMPWLALPYVNRKGKEQLGQKFDIQGIPSFVIVDKDGSTITTSGRNIPRSDPKGEQFPWHPKPVKDVGNDTDALQETPSFVVLLDGADEETKQAVESALDPLAREWRDKAKAGGDEFFFFIGTSSSIGLINRLRKLASMELPPVEKHEHPLEKIADRENWYCDGCGQKEGTVAYNCKECNFDYCEGCNNKAADKKARPPQAVLFDFNQGQCYVPTDVDCTSSASIRALVEKFQAEALEMQSLS